MTAHLEPSPLSAEVEYLRAEIASVLRMRADLNQRIERLELRALKLREQVALLEKGGQS